MLPDHHSVSECVICCSSLSDNEFGVTVVTACGHCYHESCIHQSLAYKKSCPTCRASVNEKSLRVIYLFQQSHSAKPVDDTIEHTSHEYNSIHGTAGGAIAVNTSEKEKLQWQQQHIVQLTRINRKQANDLIAAKAKQEEWQGKVSSLMQQAKEYQRDIATLKEENRLLEKKCDDASATARIHGFLQSRSDEIPPELCHAPRAITQYIMSTKTLVQTTQDDLRQAMKRVRDLEARNLSLIRKIARLREQKHQGKSTHPLIRDWNPESPVDGLLCTSKDARKTRESQIVDVDQEAIVTIATDVTNSAPKRSRQTRFPETMEPRTHSGLAAESVPTATSGGIIDLDAEDEVGPLVQQNFRGNAPYLNEDFLSTHLERHSLSSRGGSLRTNDLLNVPNLDVVERRRSESVEDPRGVAGFQQILPPCSRAHTSLRMH